MLPLIWDCWTPLGPQSTWKAWPRGWGGSEWLTVALPTLPSSHPPPTTEVWLWKNLVTCGVELMEHKDIPCQISKYLSGEGYKTGRVQGVRMLGIGSGSQVTHLWAWGIDFRSVVVAFNITSVANPDGSHTQKPLNQLTTNQIQERWMTQNSQRLSSSQLNSNRMTSGIWNPSERRFNTWER